MAFAPVSARVVVTVAERLPADFVTFAIGQFSGVGRLCSCQPRAAGGVEGDRCHEEGGRMQVGMLMVR